MKHKNQCKVLVVGAGPGGMLAAVLLTQEGIEIEIIDQARGPTTRSYACVLHSRSLALLRQAGLLQEVLASGHRIDAIEIYEGATLITEVSLSQLGGEFPYVITLSQATLETLLERRLWGVGKHRIRWNHRLARLKPARAGSTAVIEEMGMTVEGYGVPTEEYVVESEFETHADYVVGDDGPDSMVREACKIKQKSFGSLGRFTICDAETGPDLEGNARIILDPDGIAAFWPLPGNKCRWILPLPEKNSRAGLPAKNRKPFFIQRSPKQKAEFQKLIRQRAPWFTKTITEIDWCEDVSFESLLAGQFGAGHCWLAGDAAHEGGPIGMQSMNAGLADAANLALALANIMRRKAPQSRLKQYAARRRNEWLHLLALDRILRWKKSTPAAIIRHRKSIPSCLPALGRELEALLQQLGAYTARRAIRRATPPVSRPSSIS